MILATKADKLKFGQAKTAMLNIARKLEGLECLHHLVMFSATSKRGVDESRDALTQWLEEGGSETL
jgi:GTP-binding protein